MKTETRVVFVFITLLLSTLVMGQEGPHQGYFINTHWHMSGVGNQATVYFEGNAFPLGECGSGDGYFVKLQVVGLPRVTESCTRPDGSALWTVSQDVAPVASTYSYCSEYLPNGQENGAMLRGPGVTRFNYPPCFYPNRLSIIGMSFNAVTLYDVTDAPRVVNQYPAIYDGGQ